MSDLSKTSCSSTWCNIFSSWFNLAVQIRAPISNPKFFNFHFTLERIQIVWTTYKSFTVCSSVSVVSWRKDRDKAGGGQGGDSCWEPEYSTTGLQNIFRALLTFTPQKSVLAWAEVPLLYNYLYVVVTLFDSFLQMDK